jgi:hypothetical protein
MPKSIKTKAALLMPFEPADRRTKRTSVEIGKAARTPQGHHGGAGALGLER